MAREEDEFVAKALGNVTKENYEDVSTVIQGQLKVKYDLDKDATEEIQQYLEQGI